MERIANAVWTGDLMSELPEVLGMADTILVMHEGRISARLSRDEATAEAVLRAASASPESAA